MVNKQPLPVDESRRITQHEEVKGAVEARVQGEIRQQAAGGNDHAQVQQVAGDLRRKAISEVAQTESELDRARGVARISQFVDYFFYVVYGLIGIEIVLELLGARQGNGFKRFMDALTAPLLAPFRGLMADPAVGSSQLMLSFIVALLVYFLLHKAVTGMLKLFAERKSTV